MHPLQGSSHTQVVLGYPLAQSEAHCDIPLAAKKKEEEEKKTKKENPKLVTHLFFIKQRQFFFRPVARNFKVRGPAEMEIGQITLGKES